MKCKIDITAESDVPAWVDSQVFMRNINPDDMACRESKVVFDCYHPEWFRKDSTGEIFFTPPAFVFRNGHLYGVNGRHRAILLCRHLETIPLLLVNTHNWPRDKVSEILHQQISEHETIELPDLPLMSSWPS